jgi:hypothetical protein
MSKPGKRTTSLGRGKIGMGFGLRGAIEQEGMRSTRHFDRRLLSSE